MILINALMRALRISAVADPVCMRPFSSPGHVRRINENQCMRHPAGFFSREARLE